MNGQCYLMLIRDPWPDNEAQMLMKAKSLLGSIIRGDSLDVPFVNCIKCHEFEHSISEQTEFVANQDRQGVGQTYASVAAGADDPMAKYNFANGETIAGPPPAGQTETTRQKFARWRSNQAKRMRRKRSYDDLKLPDHNSVSLTKTLDSASPQLFFGCSSAERFPIAVFFFRRKTTFNIAGIVHPHTVMGFRNCVISDWATDGNTETVALNYESMAMASFLQVADSKLPQGVSWRTWDTRTSTGGEGKHWGSLLIPFTLAAIAAGSLVANLVGAPDSYFEGKTLT